jgi:mannose-6-phosphate isomerase-like protein (cupin superfamily)
MTAGDREIVATAGDIVVVPAGTPHGFVSSGEGRLRQIDIHLNPRYVTEWLT